MNLPLYKDCKPPQSISKGNAGLFFERFFNQFSLNFEGVEDGVKLEWLQNIAGSNSRGDTEALQINAHKQMDLIKQLNGKFTFFNTQWHFVTGTGYPHPVENGLNWHPVYGVPYITGAAVKGLVRAWVEQWLYDENEKDEKQARLLKWFGSTDKNPTSEGYESTTGDLIFFDALPVKHVNMKVDIMTPHQGQWYAKGNDIKDLKTDADKIPADWHDPIPIPFLVVDKNSSYLFTVAPRNSLVAKDIDMDEVTKCLINALEWLGAGAKTAGGYGQMLFDKQTTEYEEKRLLKKEENNKKEILLSEKTKNLSGLAKDYFTESTQENWNINKEAFVHVGRIESWLDKMEHQLDKKIVKDLENLINKHFKGLLENPMLMGGKKNNKPVFKLRQQNFANRLNKLLKNL
jgi:CRISPR-associated protein Cmr6